MGHGPLTQNAVRSGRGRTTTLLAPETPIQHCAFELLGVKPAVVSSRKIAEPNQTLAKIVGKVRFNEGVCLSGAAKFASADTAGAWQHPLHHLVAEEEPVCERRYDMRADRPE